MSLTFALQALLVRHESYIAGSERDRTDMSAKIERLEMEKRELQKANARTIKENRALLDELEKVNGAVAASDAYAQSLAAALESARLEVKRLAVFSSRAEIMERQLAELEAEEVEMQHELENSRAAERDLAKRCKRAERTVAELQDQIDQIEREAMEERERHDEVLSRIGKRSLRGYKGKLNTYMCGEHDAYDAIVLADAGTDARLVKSPMKDGNDVVSHHVKNILEDNANLQKGIIELRQLLHNSNAEIEALRGQLMHHQPLYDEFESDSIVYQQSDDNSLASVSAKILTLEEDLSLASSSGVSPALHIHHHHYHNSPAARNENRKMSRMHIGKERRVRSAITYQQQLSTPPISPTPCTSTPREDIIRPTLQVQGKRASTYSAYTLTSGTTSVTTSTPLSLSSAPSSPFSAHHDSLSLFEKALGCESAITNGIYPETPDSSAAGSPPPLKSSKIRGVTTFLDMDATICLPSLPDEPNPFLSLQTESKLPNSVDMKEDNPRNQRTPTVSRCGSVNTTRDDWHLSESANVTDNALRSTNVDAIDNANITFSDVDAKIDTSKDNINNNNNYESASAHSSHVRVDTRRASIASFISVSGMDIHTHSADAYTHLESQESTPKSSKTQQGQAHTPKRPGLRPLPSTLFLSQPTAVSAVGATTTTAVVATSAFGGVNCGGNGLSRIRQEHHRNEHAALSGLVKKMRSIPKMRPTGVNQIGSVMWLGTEAAGARVGTRARAGAGVRTNVNAVREAGDDRTAVKIDMVDVEGLRECLEG